MKSLFESELPIGVVPRLAAPMHAGEIDPDTKHEPIIQRRLEQLVKARRRHSRCGRFESSIAVNAAG